MWHVCSCAVSRYRQRDQKTRSEAGTLTCLSIYNFYGLYGAPKVKDRIEVMNSRLSLINVVQAWITWHLIKAGFEIKCVIGAEYVRNGGADIVIRLSWCMCVCVSQCVCVYMWLGVGLSPNPRWRAFPLSIFIHVDDVVRPHRFASPDTFLLVKSCFCKCRALIGCHGFTALFCPFTSRAGWCELPAFRDWIWLIDGACWMPKYAHAPCVLEKERRLLQTDRPKIGQRCTYVDDYQVVN